MRSWARGRILITILSIAVVCFLFFVFWTRGRREVSLEGTLQAGPEQSAFFPDGDCSKKPLWFHLPDTRVYDLNARWMALGNPSAVRIKLIGNISPLGHYGHLRGYPREIWPIKVISVTPTRPCPWPGDN